MATLVAYCLYRTNPIAWGPEAIVANLDELSRTKNLLDQTSRSFCLAKWKSATIHLFNGHTQSCHHVPSHPIKDLRGGTGLHNTPEKLRQRQQMLQGQRPKECEYCWKVEKMGEYSDRIHKSQEDYAAPAIKEVLESRLGPNINPSYLELAFDNACQFRCMYCSPTYSSRWQKEVDEYGPYPTLSSLFQQRHIKAKKPLSKDDHEKMLNAFWQWWPQLREDLMYLRLTGGEPFLSPHTFTLIDYLIDEPQRHLDFGINTNMGFSTVQFKKFLQRISPLQESVRKMTLFTSIDSVGKQAEYIRFGLNFENFQKNILQTLAHAQKPIVLCFMVTVNALSLPGLEPLLKWIFQLKQDFPQHQINVDLPYLRQPEFLSVQILTEDFKTWLESAIQFMKNHSQSHFSWGFSETEVQKLTRILPLVALGESSPMKLLLLRRDFTKMISEYDRRKACRFSDTFPEYQKFWEKCLVLKRPSF